MQCGLCVEPRKGKESKNYELLRDWILHTLFITNDMFYTRPLTTNVRRASWLLPHYSLALHWSLWWKRFWKLSELWEGVATLKGGPWGQSAKEADTWARSPRRSGKLWTGWTTEEAFLQSTSKAVWGSGLAPRSSVKSWWVHLVTFTHDSPGLSLGVRPQKW